MSDTDCIQTGEHEYDYVCQACGKPAMYEDLCGECGDLCLQECVMCGFVPGLYLHAESSDA